MKQVWLTAAENISNKLQHQQSVIWLITRMFNSQLWDKHWKQMITDQNTNNFWNIFPGLTLTPGTLMLIIELTGDTDHRTQLSQTVSKLSNLPLINVREGFIKKFTSNANHQP